MRNSIARPHNPRQQALPLETPLDHHGMLHAEPHGTVIYWQRLAPGRRWIKINPGDPVPQLVSPHHGQAERYVSVNQFDGWRLVRLLRSLRAAYVDIDGCTDLPAALDALHDAQMPAPSVAVYSGRGLHFYWLLEPVPAQSLPVWQRIQDTLLAALAPLGGDARARDCARVLRLIGSRHGKTGKAVEGRIVTGTRWTLATLANEVLGPRRARVAQVRDIRPRQQRGVGPGIYKRWHLVYRDMLRIAEHQWFGGIEAGHQDTWLFLTSVALSWFAHPTTLTAEIRAQARAWTPDWSEAEVEQKMQPVIDRALRAAAGETVEWQRTRVDPRYRFGRRTLWHWCEPMIPAELVPELRAIIPDDVARERKQARDAARYADRYTGQGVRASNEGKRDTARLMAAQGQPQTAIARALGVGRRTVQRWLV